MCWLCDSVAPVCGHARAPDLDSYFMCGLCDPNLEKSPSNLDTQTLEELIEFGEKAGEQWLVLLPKKWNQQQVYSWRFDPRELGATEAPQADKRRRNMRAGTYDGP